MKKINVNTDACIGCGACVAIDPLHFAFNDEGLSMATTNDNLEDTALNSAIDSCPTGAISIKEVDTEEDTSNLENDDCSCEDCECENACHCKED